MTPTQFRAARKSLGLSVTQMATVLGPISPEQVRRMEMTSGKMTARPVMPTTARLVRAFIEGYRPTDWPA